METQRFAEASEIQLEINETKKIGNKVFYKMVKRCLDIVISLAALVILSPILLIVAIIIKVQDGGPVIHKRYCLGKNDKEYIMYKFRSMKVNADDMIKNFNEEQKKRYMRGEKLTDDERITKIGKSIWQFL